MEELGVRKVAKKCHVVFEWPLTMRYSNPQSFDSEPSSIRLLQAAAGKVAITLGGNFRRFEILILSVDTSSVS